MYQKNLKLTQRIFALCLIVVLLFSISACSSVKNEAAFLKNMQKGLEARWKQSTKMDAKVYANASDYRNDLLGCVNAEIDKLGAFSDYSFTDIALEKLAETYFNALESQLKGYKYYGVDDSKYSELFTKAYNERAEVIYQLCEEYSFKVNSTYAATLADIMVVGEVYHEIRLALLVSVKLYWLVPVRSTHIPFTFSSIANKASRISW